MKRKSERRSAWATAPPCSRRSSSSSPGVKKSRSSTPQELHRLEQQDDLYLDITGEPRHTPTRLAPPRASSRPRACGSNFTGDGPRGHLCKCARPRERGGPALEPISSRDKPTRLLPTRVQASAESRWSLLSRGPKALLSLSNAWDPARAPGRPALPSHLPTPSCPLRPPQGSLPSLPRLQKRCHVDGV